MADTPPRHPIRTPPEALGGILGMAFGRAEPVPVRTRRRLRAAGRALRHAAGLLDDAGVRVAQAGELMSSSSAHVYRLAARLDPRPYRHAFALRSAWEGREPTHSHVHIATRRGDPTLELRRRAREGDVAAMEELERLGAPGRNVPGYGVAGDPPSETPMEGPQ